MTCTALSLFPVCVTVDGAPVLKNWTRFIGGNSPQYAIIRTTQFNPKERYKQLTTAKKSSKNFHFGERGSKAVAR